MTIASGLGSEEPHDTVIGEWADGIDERIDQVTVIFTPPQEHDIYDIVVVVIDDLDSFGSGEGLAKCAVGVVILSDHPHGIARCNAQGAQDRRSLATHGRLLERRLTGVVHRTSEPGASNSDLLPQSRREAPVSIRAPLPARRRPETAPLP